MAAGGSDLRPETDEGSTLLAISFRGARSFHFMGPNYTAGVRRARRSKTGSTHRAALGQLRCDARGGVAGAAAKLQAFERRIRWKLSAKRGAICEEAG